MRNRLIAALLAVVMLAGMLPATVFATDSDTAETTTILAGEGILIPAADLPDNDALYEAYLNWLFYGDPGVSFYGTAAGEQLTGNAKIVYTALKKQAALVASGQKSSTVFEINTNTVSAPLVFETTNEDEVSAILSMEMDLMLNALLADCPYELYWFDKVSGIAYSYYMEYGNGNTIIIQDMTFYFCVAENYQGGDSFTFDTRKTTVAQAAADNAKSIVNCYAAAPVRDKLTGYKNEICALVSYNDDAANSGNFSQNDDPWELIYVFDGIPSTNVVCEGYSKAFQYLCDLGGLDCYSVDGTMAGSDSVGPHMWNIVKLDGMNYLVDVTNSDSGTIGHDGSLFLAHGTPSSMDFTLTYTDGTIEYITMEGYTVGSGNVFYAYNDDTVALWGSSGILDISADQTPEAPELITGTCGENLTWTFDEATGTLTIAGSGDMATYYRDTESISCDTPWFSLASQIRSVVIEDGITSIGQCAFYGCEALTSVSISNTVTYIGSCAFMYCNSLEYVTLPDSVTSSDGHIFWNCENLRQVTLSKGMTTLPRYMFFNCPSLEKIEIPATVTEISEGLCVDSPRMVHIEMQGDAPTFHPRAFIRSSANFYYPVNNPTWTIDVMQDYGGFITWTPSGEPASSIVTGTCGVSVTWEMNFATGVLTIRGNGDMENYWQRVDAYITPWFSYSESIKQVVFEEGVTSVGINAFAKGFSYQPGYPNLTSITLSDTIAHIGHSAFRACHALTSIEIPASVTSIGMALFSDENNTMEIRFEGDAPEMASFPDSAPFDDVTGTAYYPAKNATWTEEVMQNYGGTITWVPYSELITGTCGENLTWTFDPGTGTLTYSGTGAMPDSTWPHPTWYNEFGGSEMIRSVVIEDGVTHIGNCAFRLCKNLTSVTIPDSVTTIGTFAFEHCTNLTSIVFPDSVTAIPFGCFNGCTNLQEFVISDTVTSIGAEAFKACSSMKSMTIPRNVTSIARGAFESSGLTEITFEGGILEIGNGAFLNLTATVYYPAGNLSFADKVTQNYGGTITWVPYGDPLPLPGGICGDNLTWTFDETTGTLTISGTGNMDDYVYTYMPYPENRASVNYPWANIASQIQTVIVEEGVTEIGEYAFWNMQNLTHVSLAEGVTEIRKNAFNRCSGLTAITLPNTLVSIGASAFEWCDLLESIHIPDGVTSVGKYAFQMCSNLNSVTLPGSVATIEEYAFRDCRALENVTISHGVTTISPKAFYYCSALKSITIPDSVTTIGEGAFSDCGLTSVKLSRNLTTLESWAFSFCDLTSVEIPASLTTINGSIFAYCRDLKEIKFVGNAPEFNEYSFSTNTATVYYPAGNATWTEEVMQNYGGTITWVPYDAVELGDATGDGVIDFSDAVLVLEYSAFLIDDSQLSLSACDVNGDGFVDFSDAVLILEYSAFLITEFPAAN